MALELHILRVSQPIICFNSQLNIKNTAFIQCKTFSNGGAIITDVPTTIHNSYFQGCQAVCGGGILATNLIDMNNNVFTDMKAESSGAFRIHTTETGNNYINNSIISSSFAANCFAFNITSPNLRYKLNNINCSFNNGKNSEIGCKASVDFFGCYIYGTHISIECGLIFCGNTTSSIKSCFFNSIHMVNHLKNDGSYYILSTDTNDLNVSDCIFSQVFLKKSSVFQIDLDGHISVERCKFDLEDHQIAQQIHGIDVIDPAQRSHSLPLPLAPIISLPFETYENAVHDIVLKSDPVVMAFGSIFAFMAGIIIAINLGKFYPKLRHKARNLTK